MTNVGRALYQFFSSFKIPAYEESSVPDEAALPYITYSPVEPNWDESSTITASVWYSGTSLVDLFSKIDEIKEKIGEGYRIPIESGGCVWLYRDSPFAQMQETDDDKVKAVYLLIGIHALCK